MEVQTWIIPAGLWHVRVHRIKAGRELDVAEGGFAVQTLAGDAKDQAVVLTVTGGVLAKMSDGMSGMINISGFEQAMMVYPEANTNVLKPRTMIPTLTARLTQGEHILISAVFGATNSKENELEWLNPPTVERDSSGKVIIGNILHNDILLR